MAVLNNRLSLHTWTIETTSFENALAVTKKAGYDGIEVRWADFDQMANWSLEDEDLYRMVADSGLAVSAMSTPRGWMWAQGARHKQLVDNFHIACERGNKLGTQLIISPVDPGTGEIPQAIERTREMGDIAKSHNVRLAIQMNSWAKQINRLDLVMEVLGAADHSHVGYLLDSYHLERSGAGGRGFEPVPVEKIFHFQISDVPNKPREPGVPLDRLPPGHGVIPFDAVFGLLAEKGYQEWLTYEAPNPALWARDPLEVVEEGIRAIKSRIGR